MKSNPVILLLITSLALLVIGLSIIVIGAYAAGSTIFTCNRVESTQIDCTMAYTRWLGQVPMETIVFKQVQGAKLRAYECSRTDSQGRRQTSQCNSLVLITAQEEFSPDLPTDLAAKINDFVGSTQPTLTYHSSRWLFSLATFGFGIIALLMGSFTGRLYRRESKPRWKRRR